MHTLLVSALVFVFASTLLCAQAGSSGPAGGKPAKDKPAAAGDQDHQMPAAPGAEHAALMKLVGDFTAKHKFNMGKDAPPMPETMGSAHVASLLDGRFLQLQETGELMGAPYSAIKTWGYNVETKRYEGTWTYTHSTAIMVLKGSGSDGGKTITCDGSYDTAKGAENFKITLKIVSDDEFIVTMAHLQPGKDADANLTSTYSRKK